jgi:senataxin
MLTSSPARDLKRLPPELHLFCPRQNDDDYDRYEHDTSAGEIGSRTPEEQTYLQRIKDAKDRRQKFMDAMGLIAYDGPETEAYKNYIWERLNDALSKCDLCIPAYYLAKLDMRDSLQQQFEDDDIKSFFSIIDNVDTERIIKGLDDAKMTLRNVPEQKRNLSCLDQASLFSIFEALSCETLLRNEPLLRTHFDEPFKLIQGKRSLKTRDYVPAATRFLFDDQPHRFTWASAAWAAFDRPPTDIEWNWTVKELMQERFTKTYEERSPTAVWRLWNGLRFIVGRLNQQQITHNLRALKPDISKMALEHLAVRTSGLRYIIQTLKLVLEKSPGDFWDAMGSISPSTVIEQIFSSPYYEKLLQDTNKQESEAESSAAQMLSWIPVFLSSLKPANQPPSCRALAAQLFRRADGPDLTEQARTACYEAALKALLQLLCRFVDSPDLRQSVGRFVLSDTLDIAGQHIAHIAGKPRRGSSFLHELGNGKSLAMDVVRNALELDCQMLKADFQTISAGGQLRQGESTYTLDIWSVVVQNLHPNDTKLSEATLRGTLALPGLERIVNRRLKEQSKESKQYNEVFDKIIGLLKQALERIADFAPEHLDHLFKTQETSMPLIAALFSADQGTYRAANDLVKSVSGQPGQKEALSHLLRAFPGTTLYSLSWTFRRTAFMKTFASIPRMLKTGLDILDILTDTQTGLLRDNSLESRDFHAAHTYWMYQWQALKTVFKETERWHTLHHDKALMTEVCRDAMQYAEALFEQYDVFASAMLSTKAESRETVDKQLLENNSGSPASALQPMSKWLRLRDEYLSATLVKLITKMLRRLSEHKIVVPVEGLGYIEEVAVKNTIKTMLSAQQKAEVVRALEIYHKKPIIIEEPVKKQKSLMEWTKQIAKGETLRSGASVSREHSVDEFEDSDVADKDLYELSKSVERSKNRLSVLNKAKASTKPALAQGSSGKALQKPILEKSKQEVSAFLETRRKETEAREARKAREREAAAQLRARGGVGEQTKGQGSGVSGIGIKGKDHAIAAESMMVSSDSESDSEDEMDRQLFGSKVKTVKQTGADLFPKMVKAGQKVTQGPVKKIKRLLQQNAMRARLSPDLSSLHQTILGWDFFADTDLPPESGKDDYTLVSNSFASVLAYQRTFEPLLILEGWQSFRSAREDGNFTPFQIKVSNRLSVDSCVEVSTTMSFAEGRELGLGTADVVLLSKDPRPHRAPDQAHCLARIKEKTAKQGQIEIVLRVNAANNPLLSVLAPGTPLWGVQILSLTPLEREYGALKALAFYDLGEEVIKAMPSPILNYSEKELQPLVQNYQVNTAQAKAVRSALDNDAFTLIQGPPGSGKTKTICAMVGAMMTECLRSEASTASRPLAPPNGRGVQAIPAIRDMKKILVCAPSNAAVDELVMRLKAGITTLDGRNEKLSIVRLGRSDAINANIRDVTLDELVNARLNLVAPKNGSDRDIHEIMLEHKDCSDKLKALRMQIDECRAKGESVPQADLHAMEGLKRKMAQLSLQIDQGRDKQKTASRDAELERRRIQQSILDSAHVLCATLSGSGHEIFQSLDIEFETVIIDEAAQSIELSALIPLKYGCSKCILVGDPKQLPPTVLSKEAARFQFEQSLFARMEKNHPSDVHLLDTQYRMHPEISVFPSKTFYESRLKDGPDMAKLRARPWHHASLLGPYRFFDVQGMQSSMSKGHSLVNIAELEVAMQLYDRLTTDCRKYDFKGKIGIITPYKGQLRELRARFSRRYGEGILSAVDFNTTDAFQGRESEIIIFSCVRATTKGIGFLSDIRRMNVGLTRAKSSLWVLGDSKTLMKGKFWNELIADAKARNLYTDGDVSRLLRRPLLTAEMMRNDVEMDDADATTTPPVQTRSSIEPPRPGRRQSNGEGGGTAGVTSTIALESLNKSADVARPSNAPIKKQASNSKSAMSRPGSAPRVGTLSSADANSGRRTSIQNPENQQSALGGVYGPSGGRTGLNDLAKCRMCGSDNHFTHACENAAARSASHGNCFRCSSALHSAWECPETRCLECGEVGHAQEACKAPIHLRLGRSEKERVQRQEEDFSREKARARQRRADRQLGEHGAQIPTVKSTLSGHARLQSSTAGTQMSNRDQADTKRKREDVSPIDAPRGPKAMRPNAGAVDLTGNGESAMQGKGAAQNPGMDVPRPSGAASRSGSVSGVLVKRKPKEADLFLKRK